MNLGLHHQGNQQKIVSVVRMNEGISRTEISKHLDLSLPSVSKHIDYLIDQQIIYEDGFDTSSGGRRPIVLRYNYQFKMVLLLNVKQDTMNYRVSYLDGSILFSETKQLDFDKLSLIDLVNEINDSAMRLFDLFRQLDLIVVSLDSVVDKEGIIHKSSNENINGINLSSAIHSKTHIQCIVVNDLDCKLLGKVVETNYQHEVMSYISFDTSSIGARHLLYYRIHHGEHYLSGSFEGYERNSRSLQEVLFTMKTSYIGERDDQAQNVVMSLNDWNQLNQRVLADKHTQSEVYSYVMQQLCVALESIYFTIDPKVLYIGGENPLVSKELVAFIKEEMSNHLGVDVNIEFCSKSKKTGKMGMLEYAILHFEEYLL